MTNISAEQTTTPTDNVLDPVKERRRLKRLIKQGKLPRFKSEITRVKTGPHPKQHKLEWKIVSTLEFLMKGLEGNKE